MRGGLRRSEGSGLLIDDPLDEGSKASSTDAALEGGELIPQNERKLRRSDGSGMLIDDPLGEGSKVSSTDRSSGAENSFLRMRDA